VQQFQAGVQVVSRGLQKIFGNMCGIAGKLFLDGQQPVDPALIERMLEVIKHRGPDGHGAHLAGPVGLGHRRLSIIDLTSNGSQPMCNEDGTVWIVFNGEIYNYPELRKQLVERGHGLRSTTDTEVIIHLYEEHGADCLQLLQGMFAFAIWDQGRQRLFLARDRVGIKPLYYCLTADAFWFASELKSILADPEVSREIDHPGVRKFLAFYYPAGEETLFRSVKKLLPGHYIMIERGRVKISQYWDLQFTRDRWTKPFAEVVEELRHLLGSTIRDHMIADVPVGVLLSGGTDSSAVLSFAVQNTEKRIKTFTVGFDGDQVVDERPYARMAARQFGTEHYDTSISAADFWEFLPSYIWHMEEPVCEPPAVALYYISKLARQQVKVLLSGEGGDEAFGGYPNYPNMLRLERINAAMGPLARPAGAIAAWMGQLLGEPRLHRYGAALGSPFSEHYFSRTSGPTFYFNRQAQELYTADFLESSISANSAGFVGGLTQAVKGQPLLDQMLYVDTKTWLPDDLLIKADKITMANSLELRVPLLDHKVLEFAASLPSEYKVGGHQTKRVLKAAFAKVLPPEILNRRKAGFPVPYNTWLQNGLADPTHDILLSDRARSRGYFRTDRVEHLLRANKNKGTYAKEIFSLLIVELWHQAFVDQTPGFAKS
jgi:asparagine synthase (glutamine-hydrolysing)